MYRFATDNVTPTAETEEVTQRGERRFPRVPAPRRQRAESVQIGDILQGSYPRAMQQEEQKEDQYSEREQSAARGRR